jgi:uncharacterized Rmd1/YagE family protein
MVCLRGQSSTDDNGIYKVSWTRSTKPTQFKVSAVMHYKDNIFRLANTAGTTMRFDTNLITTAASSSYLAPQNVGTWWKGGTNDPDPYANSYWAAERLWRYVLSQVGYSLDNFTDVEIRGFSNDTPGFLGSQPTSGAQGATKRVQLDADAGFKPQARVMHELGHIATYLTHPWLVASDYTWSPPGQPAGPSVWGQTTPEWGVSAFEEAFSTHFGSIAFWGANAVTPTTCLSQTTCYAAGIPIAGSNIETTSYPYDTNNCGTAVDNPEDRWPEGTGLYQNEDPWNSDKTALDNRDGRGSTSYCVNYKAYIQDIDTLHIDNCWPK